MSFTYKEVIVRASEFAWEINSDIIVYPTNPPSDLNWDYMQLTTYNQRGFDHPDGSMVVNAGGDVRDAVPEDTEV